jgi:hypothetical protein
MSRHARRRSLDGKSGSLPASAVAAVTAGTSAPAVASPTASPVASPAPSPVPAPASPLPRGRHARRRSHDATSPVRPPAASPVASVGAAATFSPLSTSPASVAAAAAAPATVAAAAPASAVESKEEKKSDKSAKGTKGAKGSSKGSKAKGSAKGAKAKSTKSKSKSKSKGAKKVDPLAVLSSTTPLLPGTPSPAAASSGATWTASELVVYTAIQQGQRSPPGNSPGTLLALLPLIEHTIAKHNASVKEGDDLVDARPETAIRMWRQLCREAGHALPAESVARAPLTAEEFRTLALLLDRCAGSLVMVNGLVRDSSVMGVDIPRATSFFACCNK